MGMNIERNGHSWISDSYKVLTSDKKACARNGCGKYEDLGITNAIIDAYENPNDTNLKLASALRAYTLNLPVDLRRQAIEAYKQTLANQ